MSDESTFGAGFMDDYFAECDEHLGAVRRLLLDLADATGDRAVRPAVLEELFRSFHSIKGISGMVGLREAEMLAHQLESYLRQLRQRDARLGEAGVDALVAGVDALEAVIAARRDSRAAPEIDPVVSRLESVTGVVQAAPPTRHWRVTFVPNPALLARGVNVDSVRVRLREAGDIVDATPKVLPDGIAFEFVVSGTLDEPTMTSWREDGMTIEPAEPAAPPQTAAPAGDIAVPSAPLSPAHVVRVDLTRLDDLMRMIGEIVISRARLDDALARVEPHVPPAAFRGVQENLQAMERQLRDLREGVMRVRLVPVAELFRRVPFVVRDLARDLGAPVRLELRGQDTEIDKFLIERMMDPILHLVRNAVSHAFERPDERVALGKPAEGTLTVAAASVGDTVVLEVADDGRGIDQQAVAARARAAGLEVPEPPFDPRVLLDLICTPGFSTRESSDRASGRGVGMAVVKTTVEDLNGQMTLQTVPGEGTRFVMELPLTLAITDALIAHVGDRTFAVPQSNVREVVELDPAEIRRIEGHEVVPFRGGSLPVLRLSALFGVPAHPRRALHAFVVGAGADAVAVAVDRISGQREIVVRSMADSLIKADGVAGATDLGDGRVVLILHLPDLIRQLPARGGVSL